MREVRTSTGTLIATYTYDTDHRRVRKDLASGADLDILFSGWRAVEYRDASTQAILNQRVATGIRIREYASPKIVP
jgi:hypothetical protein